MSRRRGSLNQTTKELYREVLNLAEEYEHMTVRQVFYQLVARNVIEKTEAAYGRVQRHVRNMRMNGYLGWDFIVDYTRWRRQPNQWKNAAEYIEHWRNGYRRDLWQNQPARVELWLEKEALGTIVSEVTARWGVPLMVSRGLSSVTFLNAAVEHALSVGEELYIYTLYDYDKSGDTAHREIDEWFRYEAEGLAVYVERLALTRTQIQAWGIPGRPGKQGEAFAAELDALPPDTLQVIVEEAITSHIAPTAWQKQERQERRDKKRLQGIQLPD